MEQTSCRKRNRGDLFCPTLRQCDNVTGTHLLMLDLASSSMFLPQLSPHAYVVTHLARWESDSCTQLMLSSKHPWSQTCQRFILQRNGYNTTSLSLKLSYSYCTQSCSPVRELRAKHSVVITDRVLGSFAIGCLRRRWCRCPRPYARGYPRHVDLDIDFHMEADTQDCRHS